MVTDLSIGWKLAVIEKNGRPAIWCSDEIPGGLQTQTSNTYTHRLKGLLSQVGLLLLFQPGC